MSQLEPSTGSTFSPAAASLWASAFVVLALVLVQAGRMRDNTARADLVSRVGEYTVLTADAGNDDVLLVLDGRGEQLFVYHVKNQTTLEFLGRESVRDLFLAGKRIGPGAPR